LGSTGVRGRTNSIISDRVLYGRNLGGALDEIVVRAIAIEKI
jgi:hypothetical protein